MPFTLYGALRLPSNAEHITDADEEIFLLYTDLQAAGALSQIEGNFRGLGYIDSHKDVLTVNLELSAAGHSSPQVLGKRRNRARRSSPTVKIHDRTVEIELAQDKTALRSRKGDTGSVLWRASMDFAQLVLQQAHVPSSQSLFDYAILKTQHLLELGSGTGFLSIAMSSLVRRYTATDITDMIPLLHKNVSLNFPGWPTIPSALPGGNIHTESLDWQTLHAISSSQKHQMTDVPPVDLILAVDCIYHPSLLPSFVAAIDFLTTPQRTAVLVVSELRAEDVVREFLDLWLAVPGWRVWRIVDGALGRPYVMWLGWKDVT